MDALSALAITETGIDTRALDPDRKQARNELNSLLMSLPRGIRDRLLALFEQFTGKKVRLLSLNCRSHADVMLACSFLCITLCPTCVLS